MRALSSTFSTQNQNSATRKHDECAQERIDSQTFRQIMREVAAPVAIVAAGDPGRRTGLTATAICPVSDNPPTVLVCVNQNAIAHASIIESGSFSINFLSSDQEAIAIRFSGANRIYGEDRFSLGSWERGSTGAPVLRHAICSLECQLTEHQTIATHTVFVGQLISGQGSSNCGALLYRHGTYRHLAPAVQQTRFADCQS